jgi:hypothetical protein
VFPEHVEHSPVDRCGIEPYFMFLPRGALSDVSRTHNKLLQKVRKKTARRKRRMERKALGMLVCI